MSDKTHVVSHTHASVINSNGPKSTSAWDTNITEHKSGESTSKSPKPKRKENIFMKRCIGEIKNSSKSLMYSLRVSDDMKMNLFMSMH